MAGRRTLFLHVGLPRCGSSALQDWADSNRALLAAQDLTWPATDDAGLEAPRHQWLTRALRDGPAGGDAGRVAHELDGAAGDLLISDEALSRQFDDFAPAHLGWFRDATAGWDVRLILMIRPIGDWQRSMWKQSIVSPFHDGDEVGLPLGLADFTGLPRVQRLTDRRTLRRDLQAGFGARDLIAVDAEGDWGAELARLMDLDLSGATMPQRRHESLPDAVIEIVRAINAEGLAGGPRDGLLTLMQLALDTRSDTLRELVRRRGGALGDDAPAVARALPRVARASGDLPATRIAIEAMAGRLAELHPELRQEIPG